ncbi:MAG: 3-isopropylmalate dehydratase large subunit [Clostridiaceae bacterium]|nr:3-isopropylmalate dehydratase large subunit [Clostridiaceae bacterium]
MAMTMSQKILASHSGKANVKPGELITATLDMVLGNDITSPLAIQEFKKIAINKVFDNEKIALVPDHFCPNKDIKSAQQAKIVRDFAKEYAIKNYFEVGQMGIEHALLPEKGLVTAGDVVIGADSHTCTYGALGAFSTGIGSTDMAAGMATGQLWFKVPHAIKVLLTGKPKGFVGGKDIILHLIGKIGVDGARYMSLEFTGDAIRYLSMDDRFTIANMAIEAVAKNVIFPVDDKTLVYIREHSSKSYKVFKPDDEAEYYDTVEIDLSELDYTVACPHLPSNTKPASELSGVNIDQVVIGSCTNGRINDLRIAARILKGKRVADGVRCLVFPATQKIYLQAIQEGLIQTMVESGAAVSTPTCGPCLGGHMGILTSGEKCVATTNRNFIGRMGHIESEVYLASPAVAAASAITGKITIPEEV